MAESVDPRQRLFLGLWPTPEARAAVQSHADAWSWPAGARRTPVERLHVTLHFIGDVAVSRLPALRTALAMPWAGCELLLDRGEVWPGGIAVLEAGTVPPALATLHAQLARRLRELELPVEERRYRPHVTLARRASGAKPPPQALAMAWTMAPGYALVRSLPSGGYEPVQLFG